MLFLSQARVKTRKQKDRMALKSEIGGLGWGMCGWWGMMQIGKHKAENESRNLTM